MKKFFSYFGGKGSLAPHYGPPRRKAVCEPFAGGAGYSCFWEPEEVHLFDTDGNVCAGWDFIINCSEQDILDMPDVVRSDEEYHAMPLGQRFIFCMNVMRCSPGMTKNRPQSYVNFLAGADDGPNTFTRESRKWQSGHMKRNMIKSKRKMGRWTITHASYETIPEELIERAHFHVDPPYRKQGKGYRQNDIDYKHLGEWCRRLPCADVCEGNEHGDWLPFVPLRAAFSTFRSDGEGRTGNRDKIMEYVWASDIEVPIQRDLFA